MTTSLLPDIPLDVLATRMAATALVVMGVAWAVGRFGPLIGGALAGLPIVLGPGFYFMATQASAAFVAQAASYALLSLCATQFFLFCYMAAASRARPWVALACAVSGWLLAVLLFQGFPAQPLIGVLLFVLATLLCRTLGRRFVLDNPASQGRSGFGLLLARGVLAGVLVAAVTTAGAWLGPAGAGLLLAFPIGYTVLAVTIHQTLGAASVIATLYSALYGTASLVGFCAVLASSLPHWTTHMALGSALLASVSFTLALVLHRRAAAHSRDWARERRSDEPAQRRRDR